jgi:transposase InsO family protein
MPTSSFETMAEIIRPVGTETIRARTGVLDLSTRQILGWAMRDRMRAELTIAILTIAIQRRSEGRPEKFAR